MSEKLRYVFHPVADEQQTKIWLYTYRQWGEKQADQYIDGLHEKLSQIAEIPALLRDLPEWISEGVKHFHYGRHYVFVKLNMNVVQVLTILHQSMDIPSQLLSTLNQTQSVHEPSPA